MQPYGAVKICRVVQQAALLMGMTLAAVTLT